MTYLRKEVIGDATLYLGDAREVLPTLAPADCGLMDPPYLVTSGGGSLEAIDKAGFSGWMRDAYNNSGEIVACDLDWSDWLPMLPAALRPDAHVYVFTNDRNLVAAQSAAEAAGLQFHRLLTWDKRAAMPNRWYQQTCEFVLFMRKGKAFRINDPSSKALVSIFQRDESDHPTEKPVSLCRFYIENSTRPGETVLDPFMGSGTTGVAAIGAGRKFIGIELTEQWFAVACDRIAKAAAAAPGMFDAPPAEGVQANLFADRAGEAA